MDARNRTSRVTRREVDGWLAQVQHQIDSLLKGPAGELRARLVLLHKRVSGWREKLSNGGQR